MIILNYGNSRFICSNKEKTIEIKKLIQRAYPNLDISISDSQGYNPDSLKFNQKYKIRVEKNVRFTNLNDSNSSKTRPSKDLGKVIQVRESNPNSSFYKFEFKEQVKMIKLQNNLTIEDQEKVIKNGFNIIENETLIYMFVNDDDKKECKNIIDKQMTSFKKGTIHINIDLESKPILILDANQIKDIKKMVDFF